MALATTLAELQAEAQCPLCQGPLRNPLTLDCGHNCCSSCLRRRWQHLWEPLPCPVCQHPCPRAPRGPNRQLALLADLVSQLPDPRPKRHARETPGRCAVHQQALSLFCNDHLELLCGQCATSAAHRGHRLMPIGLAAAHHRTKLKGYLEPLRKQLEEADRQLEGQDAELEEIKDQLKTHKENVHREARQLKHFLKRKERAIENKMFRDLARVYRDLVKNKAQLSQYAQTLKKRLMDAKLLSLKADADLQAEGSDLHPDWRECLSRELPTVPAIKYEREGLYLPPHYIGLDNMMVKFQENLTLDPETAHGDLLISQKRTASYCQKGRKPTQTPPRGAFTSHVAVLGMPGFVGGRHFWQVEIRGPVSSVAERQDRECQRIGVFLDYDLGEISFYNWSKRTHLGTIAGRGRGIEKKEVRDLECLDLTPL
ncbi:tripartite motif-containing protein 75-like [Sorex fumeus]|uniref:tripartite motif-containing protein 75-like n=1 Tax=Sorex fumeus TaxID=62283 RepID=UPI0024AD50AC|nr:tripartite motif-containing protein 75-like [Sorex fumeus]